MKVLGIKIVRVTMIIVFGLPISVVHLISNILTKTGEALDDAIGHLDRALYKFIPNTPSVSDQIKALKKVKRRAEDLRTAQKAYMADRGNNELGKAVGEASTKLDEALSEIK